MVIADERRKKLDIQCNNTLQHAYRPGTIRNYRSRTRMYYRFCGFYGLQPFPADEWQLVRFVCYVANAVTSFDTVTGYLSSVKRLHKLGAMAFPGQVHLLKLELMAIKKELMHLVKKAPPITPTILLEIAGKVDWTREEEMVAYAALVIGFTLFLWKSNLVSESVNSFNKKEQLTVEDVWCHQELVMVEIKWSKTLQTRDRELVIPLVPAKTQMLCAAGWVKRILRSRRKVSVGDPLFGYQANGLVIPLTYDKLSKRLKEWVSATGRNGQEYTLHGLHRGGPIKPLQ